MKAVLRALIVGALAVVFAPAAFAGHTHTPNSSFKLNLADSDFGDGPKMQSDLIHVHIDTEKWMTFDETMVDGDGKTWNISWAGPQDGTAKPVKGMDGATYSSKTDDDTGRLVLPDGTSLDQAFTFSDDKKKVTMKVEGKTKDGKTFHQTLIYDQVS